MRAIVEAEYPRFSAAEMARRRDAIARAMTEAEVDHVLIYGMNRTGNIIQYLTQWPMLTEAAGVHTPGQRDCLYIHYYNHINQARRLAEAQVEWGDQVGRRLRHRRARAPRRKARSGRRHRPLGLSRARGADRPRSAASRI